MGQIYKRAVCVHACVGGHADDSERIFRVVRDQERILKRMHEKVSRNNTFLDGMRSRSFKLESVELEIRTSLLMDAEARSSLLRSFVAFIDRTYFQRIWILQELFFASKTFFHCGDDDGPGHLLVMLSSLLERWVVLSESSRAGKNSKHAKLFNAATRHLVLRRRSMSCEFGWEYFTSHSWVSRLSCLQLASRHEPFSFGLGEVVHYMSEFDCADPRDRLYGILHLAYGENDSYRPIPDYGKDRFAVVTELMGALGEMAYSLGDLKTMINFTQMFCVPLDLNRFDQAWKEHQAPRTFYHSPLDRLRAEAKEVLFCRSGIQLATPIRALDDSSRLDASRRERELYLTEAPEITCFHYFNSKIEMIYIPPETRVGDLLLNIRTRRGLGGWILGPIVSRKELNRFGIVGLANHPGLFEGIPVEWSEKKVSGATVSGEIFWHPLELQILATVLAHYMITEYDQQDLNRRLNKTLLPHLKMTEFRL